MIRHYHGHENGFNIGSLDFSVRWGAKPVSSFISYVSVGKILDPVEAAFPCRVVGEDVPSLVPPMVSYSQIHLLIYSFICYYECLLHAAQCQVLSSKG